LLREHLIEKEKIALDDLVVDLNVSPDQNLGQDQSPHLYHQESVSSSKELSAELAIETYKKDPIEVFQPDRIRKIIFG
jgi:hypothetical protein